jgi:hypothetical protein
MREPLRANETKYLVGLISSFEFVLNWKQYDLLAKARKDKEKKLPSS